MQQKDIFDALHDLTTLRDITITNKNFNFPLNKKLDEHAGFFDININVSIEEENDQPKSFLIIKNISIAVIDGDDTDLANINVLYLFSFLNDNDFITISNDKFVLNPNLSDWLDHIVLATTRGIMYSEFRGTFLEHSILPLLKPSTLREK